MRNAALGERQEIVDLTLRVRLLPHAESLRKNREIGVVRGNEDQLTRKEENAGSPLVTRIDGLSLSHCTSLP
jgi:hypothetical protein